MAGKRKLTARQLRWLFATGRLRASGKGKDRKVSYSRDGNWRRVPSKAERDATRAARIEAGKARAVAVLSSGNGVWNPQTVRNVLGDKGQKPAMKRLARTANKQLGVKAGVERASKQLKATPQAVAQKLMSEPKGARRERYFKLRQAGFDGSRADRVKNALGGAGRRLYADSFKGGKPGAAVGVKDVQRRAYAALKRKEEAAKRKYDPSDPVAFRKYFSGR